MSNGFPPFSAGPVVIVVVTTADRGGCAYNYETIMHRGVWSERRKVRGVLKELGMMKRRLDPVCRCELSIAVLATTRGVGVCGPGRKASTCRCRRGLESVKERAMHG